MISAQHNNENSSEQISDISSQQSNQKQQSSRTYSQTNNDLLHHLDFKVCKKIQKQKKNRKQNNQLKQLIYYGLNPNETIQIFSGIYITNDGLVRFCYNQSWFSFGYQQFPVVSIQKLNELDVFDLQLQQWNYPYKPIDQALKHIEKIPDLTYHKLSENLYKYQETIKFKIEQIVKMNLTLNQKQQKDEEFQSFMNESYIYLKQYNQQNPTQMYHYAIGRLNYEKKDLEFKKSGFSKSYIEFLGLDDESFVSMVLRHQKIDLFQNRQEILELSLKGLISRNNYEMNDSYICNIQTFDGFPIKIFQRKQFIKLPTNKDYHECFQSDYLLCITEIDTDLEDLYNLIQYRQRISQFNSKLNIEDYLKKELSQKFEDVEYSVLSESFLQKYYQSNLQFLYNKQHEMEKKVQNISKLKDKICNYKDIN